MKARKKSKRFVFFVSVFTIIGILIFILLRAKASFYDGVINLFVKKDETGIIDKKVLMNEDLLKPKSINLGGNSEVSQINKDGVISVKSGSLRVSTEKEKVLDGIISLYEVKAGDSLGTIAELFGISPNTIVWANDLKNKSIHPGQTLLIFPINGVEYKVKNGGTISDIAKKYKADANEIAEYNGLAINTKLSAGDTIFIPDAEADISLPTKTSTVEVVKKYKNNIIAGYFMRPVSGCVKTQGLHGPYHSAVDIGCPIGTTVVAAASGVVIRADASGYNGGYGEVIIISHPNGTQSIYAHLSRINVKNGESVKQGEVIGASGSSGKSTGPHLHFETRGTGNPF